MPASDLGTIAIAALTHLCALWECPRQVLPSADWATPQCQEMRTFDGQLSLQHLHDIALMGNRQEEQTITRGTHESNLR